MKFVIFYTLLFFPFVAFTANVVIENKLKINAKLAKTESEKQTGLMYVKNLPANEGMLFVHNKEYVSMWMKNTLIPLDIIFINEKNEIVQIAHMAKPLSLDVISSNSKVKYVLEINGGIARKQNLQIGDKVNIIYEQ